MRWLPPRLAATVVAVAVLTAPTPQPRRSVRDYPAIASPNVGYRPAWTRIDCVVVHATCAPLWSTVHWFMSPGSRVSAHYIIAKDGRVVQMVPVRLRAWHAGYSRLGSRWDVNDFSVGIELVNRDDGRDPYTLAQVRSLVTLLADLSDAYGIPLNRIVPHSLVALPPGRKVDPRRLSFYRLRHRVMLELDR